MIDRFRIDRFRSIVFAENVRGQSRRTKEGLSSDSKISSIVLLDQQISLFQDLIVSADPISLTVMGFRKYSPDLKWAAVRARLDGKNLAEINLSLGATISRDSLSRWTGLYERTQAVVCNPDTYLTRGRPFELMQEDLDFVKDLVTEKPSLYADEIQRRLTEEHGITVSVSTILNTLHGRLNMSKKTMRTFNRRQDALEQAHYIWQVGSLPSNYLVFVDESGVCLEAVQRTQGWAEVGERTPRVERERSTHRFNIIPAISTSGLVAHMVQEETVERNDFEFYLEQILLPAMNPFPGPNSVLIMDNAQIHHNGLVADLVEERGCLLIYLPAYSPEFNPIEKAFSVYKSTLGRYEELLTGGEEDYEVIDGFVSLVFTSDLTRNLFRASGYSVVD
ncbi:hypothetical protein Pst134EA_011271 [Puccinia striiformis f. sp. tritici]|uniref:hypothetical protein n=2 Tax=Puccinia striiformis f. sp. tritici TaxID=168172 RepID=UPI002007A969|nr:hypothetical protein Pst134EA_030340 [Puccinia striiformis f. sp. tritici]XP_047807088.1 hypothetical protein Pst134EA_011271 [Puccinia striiformis f. sp. tritici]KAH9446421.1 hypothetical protein Pst134EA_030340 [Puccinia striiformis f. sp. tritici]KAH9462676.1 hypothetical protein Pst134EB_033323 [Puccinia striiformis f. sp. tritici]KAH9467634.1 hypothetical protein Pst134EA_011271 [Puccinia striiformis f. sp. tritici]